MATPWDSVGNAGNQQEEEGIYMARDAYWSLVESLSISLSGDPMFRRSYIGCGKFF